MLNIMRCAMECSNDISTISREEEELLLEVNISEKSMRLNTVLQNLTRSAYFINQNMS